jgi:8-oxo-dGTP diphosphatase
MKGEAQPMKKQVELGSGIFAAGGVVFDRRGRIAVIHRPRYDDWCLPKGKLEKGEAPLVAAVREVWEETCTLATPQEFLGTICYMVKNRPKWVFYWAMECHSILDFHVNEEVDVLEWLSPAAAKRRLEHQGERDMLTKAVKGRKKRL